MNTVDFSETYARPTKSYFWVLKGNPTEFNPIDINNSTIGLRHGTGENEACLKKQNMKPKSMNVYTSEMSLEIALNSKEIQAVLASHLPDTTKFERIGNTSLECEEHGYAVMFPMGSPDLLWFNEGLKLVKEGGQYLEMCRNAPRKFKNGETLNCFK